MDNKKKIPVPNTVGELIEFLKQFPENAVLDICKTEGYYDGSEFSVLSMSYEHNESLGVINVTFD